MNHQNIISKLEKNATVFHDILAGTPLDEYLWRYDESKWCLLEILCHLNDEEQEDFRTRIRYTVESLAGSPPRIDPVAWVKERNYIKKDFDKTLDDFLFERNKSVKWLSTISPSLWENNFIHPILGKVSAEFFLANWLAHDYLHIRQITRTKYLHLKISTDEDLKYAGEW